MRPHQHGVCFAPLSTRVPVNRRNTNHIYRGDTMNTIAHFILDPVDKSPGKYRATLSLVKATKETQSPYGLRVDDTDQEKAKRWAWSQVGPMAGESTICDAEIASSRKSGRFAWANFTRKSKRTQPSTSSSWEPPCSGSFPPISAMCDSSCSPKSDAMRSMTALSS